MARKCSYSLVSLLDNEMLTATSFNYLQRRVFELGRIDFGKRCTSRGERFFSTLLG